MPRYRKKPLEIDAILWTGDILDVASIMELAGDTNPVGVQGDKLAVYTLEGVMIAQPGDWIIKGVKGEIYPCKPEIFAETYDFMTDPSGDGTGS